MAKSDYDIVVVSLPGPEGAVGPRIKDLSLPDGAVITLITRRGEVVLPKGDTRLQGWDEVTLLAHAPDEDTICARLSEAFPAVEVQG
jgi:potassium/hydrogen antiporter